MGWLRCQALGVVEGVFAGLGDWKEKEAKNNLKFLNVMFQCNLCVYVPA